MRLLFIANIFPPVVGGSATVYQEYCTRLSDSVAVLAPWRNYRDGHSIPNWRETDERQTFPVTRIELLRSPLAAEGEHSHWGRLMDFVHDQRLRNHIRSSVLRMIREWQADVVCLGELYAFGWLACELQKAGVRVVQFVHGEELTTACASRRMRAEVEAALQTFTAVIAVSGFTRDLLLKRGVPAARVHLIPNGVDTQRFTPETASVNVKKRHALEKRRVLLTVSRLERKKGHAGVLRALPELIERFPDLLYLIVGNGPARAELEALTDLLNLRQYVVFAGYVPDADLPDYYRACEVFIMPNTAQDDGDTEGFGLVFLEASACGKPVIGGRDGGVVDAVVDGNTGLLIDGNAVDQISGALTRLLADQSYAKALGEAGHLRAQDFDWSRNAVRLKEICSGARLAA